jgi:glutamate-1-semialdehyde 2,1-aminomutase
MSDRPGPAERVQATYVARTKRSRELFAEAGETFAGGVTRTSIYFAPHPSFIAEGKGARIVDVDGNAMIDFHNNFSALLHGHAFPPIVEAVAEQLRRGSAYAAPSEAELKLAQLIQKRVPSLERIRFTSSGSEAVMFSLRLARAFTSRRKIAKFEGGFHGAHDLAQVSVSPRLDAAGPADEPHGVPGSDGIPKEWADDVVVLPFNDIGAVERILDREASSIAALIVEPVTGVGGIVAARPGFLAALREITSRHGILLLFDEIVSLRIALGGGQAYYGVRPDLTMVGKIVSGGFPLAAFGGRADIMALVDSRAHPPRVPQSGTFTAAAACCAAGLAAYGAFTKETLSHVDALALDLRTRTAEILDRLDVDAQVIGIGSLFNIHFTRERIDDYRAIARSDLKRRGLLSLALMNRGIFLTPRGQGCISSVMTSSDVDAFVSAVEVALVEDLEVRA